MTNQASRGDICYLPEVDAVILTHANSCHHTRHLAMHMSLHSSPRPWMSLGAK
jgi:Cft2 family RNA processing exonuclease